MQSRKFVLPLKSLILNLTLPYSFKHFFADDFGFFSGMADLLSVTASIISVLQLTGTIIRYLGNVQDATGYKTRLLLEVSGAKGVLETLRDLSQESVQGDPILSTLGLLGEPLKHLESTLRKLENALAPAQDLRKLGKAFKWPFEKGEIMDILGNIERQKMLFGLALQADHLELSRAVKLEIESLRVHQRDQEMRDIISWISLLKFWPKHQDIFAKHQEGTGSWLFSDPKFLAWKTGIERVLWCPGVPGAGITILSSMVIDHLSATFKEPDVGVVGIYCDYNEFNQMSTPKYIANSRSNFFKSAPSSQSKSERHLKFIVGEVHILVYRNILNFCRRKWNHSLECTSSSMLWMNVRK